MAYEKLFSPLNVGSITIKNRIVMPPMATGLAGFDGEVNDDIVEYFKARAKGGFGLVFTEFARVSKDGSGGPNQLGVYNPALGGGLKKITDAVHRYDTKIFMQIHHAGRSASVAVTGKQPIAPSAVTAGPGYPMPREMTIDEIHTLVEQFINAAVIAKNSGFDGVEVHVAHGYMLNQFVSPFSNKRTDEYGKTLEGRLRIVREIMEGIREKCGEDYPVSVRISADEFVEGGITIDYAVEMAKLLEKYGADIISVSGGGSQAPQGVIAPPLLDEGWMVPLAEAVKKAVSVPVVAVSLIRDFSYAENIIKEGKCDFVAFARPSLSDPAFPNKLKSGREDEIKRCIVCMHCSDAFYSARIDCAVNPVSGFEKEFKSFNKNGAGRKVVVIGGGPAGCEAARVLAVRGFSVVLFEKDERLGGQLNVAKLPPHKYRLEWTVEYYEKNLARLGVDIRLNTEASLQSVSALDPYAVILASGASDFIPAAIDIKNSPACTAPQVLTGETDISGCKTAIVVGAGMTGLETAHFLHEKGILATVVDMVPVIGPGLSIANTRFLIPKLKSLGIDLIPGLKLLSAENGTLKFSEIATGAAVEKQADLIVFASGIKSQNQMADSLAKKFERVSVIGDAYKPGQIAPAVRGGFMAAYTLDDGQDIYD